MSLLPDISLSLKQLFFGFTGVSLFFYISRFNIRAIANLSKPFYWITVLLLVLVLLIGEGEGVRRWIDLGPVNLQPSEIAKVSVPLYLMGVRGNLKKLMAGMLPWFLILVEPDLATSSVVLLLTLYVIFITARDLKIVLFLFSVIITPVVSFWKWTYAAFLAAVSVSLLLLRASMGWMMAVLGTVMLIGLSTPVLWEKGLKEYQRKRILALLNPTESREVLWQSYQSKVTLANARPFGKGISGSTQKNYGFLPASHTDFVFAAFVEVYGYIAGFLLIVLLYALPLLLLKLSFSGDVYARNVLSTAAVFFAYQTSVNLFSVMGLLPIAGIPLPFVSYGGSHLLTEWLWLALAYSAHRWRLE